MVEELRGLRNSGGASSPSAARASEARHSGTSLTLRLGSGWKGSSLAPLSDAMHSESSGRRELYCLNLAFRIGRLGLQSSMMRS